MATQCLISRWTLLAMAVLATPGFWCSEALGAIYLDEDFEGPVAFVDRDFAPTLEGTVPYLPMEQGINIRAYSDDQKNPKVSLGEAEGTVVNGRGLSGTRSYRLESGQRLAVQPGQFAFRNGNWFRCWQFAVSVDNATANLAAGTRVGRYTLDFSTDGAGLTPDVTVAVNLVADGSGSVDVLCENNGFELGSVDGSDGDWLLVTLISQSQVTDTTRLDVPTEWEAYDPVRKIYVGPQPVAAIATGISLYGDKAGGARVSTLLTRDAHLGSAWGNNSASNTYEIGWAFEAENGGTLYLDDLYWDAGQHADEAATFEREQAARMSQFVSDTLDTREPGFASVVEKVYVIGHSHLDIGFTQPPEQVAQNYKNIVDNQLNYLNNHPGYHWNLEETWVVAEWMERSSPAEIENLMNYVREGRVSIHAGHSTLHSAKAGVEELHRLLWNTGNYRRDYNLNIRTVMHDDVPGATWAYPQALDRSGVDYLVCGQNLFIGGGFTQPHPSYLFWWEGPDGSRVLTWSARKSYVEALDGNDGWGFPWGNSAPINQTRLADALSDLDETNYPYDAVMIQHAFDNAAYSNYFVSMQNWNLNNQNPQFVSATPEEFFDYMLAKYGDEIPSRQGNWTTNWDTGGIMEPQSEKIVKNAQDEVLASEKILALAAELGLATYPHGPFDNAWDMMLTVDEHSGGGGGWAGYWTQAQTDQNNEQHWAYALSARDSDMETRDAAAVALEAITRRSGTDSIVVFNPLSWERTDLARVTLEEGWTAGSFRLLDAATGEEVTYQSLGGGEILFVAAGVPSVGHRRYLLEPGAPSDPAGDLTGDNSHVANTYYEVAMDAAGYVASLVDRRTSRELVDVNDTMDFNREIQGTNLQYFFGTNDTVPNAAVTQVAAGLAGPVARSVVVTRENHPHARAEVILYEGLDRVDIINRPDREDMLYATLDDNSRYYGFTFPFALTQARARIETAAGWLDPRVDSLPGSYTGNFVMQNAVNMAEAAYGVTIASPDVYVTGFGGFKTGNWNSINPTFVSTFIRYVDETSLSGGGIGTVVVEPGSDPQWDLLYAIRAHEGAFDPVREGRFGWEICSPLRAEFVAASEAASGPLIENRISLLNVNADNVAIIAAKEATWGTGTVVKLQEMGGVESTQVMLGSDRMEVLDAVETTPLEEDLTPQTGGPVVTDGEVALTIGAHEIRTLRLDLQIGEFLNSVPRRSWEFYE